MANIYLGVAGAEVLLPALNWMAGGEYEAPVGFKKNVDRANALDGSVRVNFRSVSQKTFELEWALLDASSVLALSALAELNIPLRYQNNWVDATWRWVYVAAFDYQAIQSTQAATPKYRATLMLEELK